MFVVREAPGVVETQAKCRNCRYNLTGLVHSRCPECGCLTTQPQSTTPLLRGEHVLFGIDAMAIVMGILFLSALPNGDDVTADGAFVGAMLAPLQSVLALAAGLVAMHLWILRRRTWMTGLGGTLPLAVAIGCFIAAVQ